MTAPRTTEPRDRSQVPHEPQALDETRRADEPGPSGEPGHAATPVRRSPRGPADPVRALMHRHRELCERAVDPLEIAAGLEAHGLTDRTAARFRHRDVFSLAEELYARVPRGAESAEEPVSEHPPLPHAPLLGLGPGGCAIVTAVATGTTHGEVRLAAVLLGVLATGGALVLTLRRGPLNLTGRTVPAGRLSVTWLLVYALCGDGLLDQLSRGGPDGPWPPAGSASAGTALAGTLSTGAPLIGLALAVAPAAWCARFFALLARRKLAASRGTAEFAAHTRPLAVGVTALFTAAPAALVAAPGFTAGTAALAVLLFVAGLLVVHGYRRAAAAVLATSAVAEALALATVLVGRVPGGRFVAAPVDALGAGAVPVLVCGTGALVLLVHATAALSRASAHS